MKRNFSEVHSALRAGEDKHVEQDSRVVNYMAKRCTSATNFPATQSESRVKDTFTYHQWILRPFLPILVDKKRSLDVIEKYRFFGIDSGSEKVPFLSDAPIYPKKDT
jgi:hypothetical protein